MTASTPPLSDPRSTTAAVSHPDSGGASMTTLSNVLMSELIARQKSCDVTAPDITTDRIAELESALRAREAEAEQHLPATVPACPEWCDLPAGHEYDSYKDDLRTWVRCHQLEIAEAVWLQQDEETTDGAVTLCPVSVRLSVCDPEVLDAAQSRKLASELLKAAERLEAVAA